MMKNKLKFKENASLLYIYSSKQESYEFRKFTHI